MLEEISNHFNFDNGRSSRLVLIVSWHVQTLFLCCFKSTMASDQNIKNKILTSKIETAYSRYMVDWQVLPRKCLFCYFALIFYCKGKPLLEILFVVDRMFFGPLRPEDIQYIHSWKLKTAGSWNHWNFCKFFRLY